MLQPAATITCLLVFTKFARASLVLALPGVPGREPDWDISDGDLLSAMLGGTCNICPSRPGSTGVTWRVNSANNYELIQYPQGKQEYS